jgi:hypothetical protein
MEMSHQPLFFRLQEIFLFLSPYHSIPSKPAGPGRPSELSRHFIKGFQLRAPLSDVAQNGFRQYLILFLGPTTPFQRFFLLYPFL